nr:PREDICTED: trafficking kinesin-binding protein 1 [Latimeria chalumnae]|eukprot:XP_006004743.1 PREDICTED: trafficking kinesin-binding protein 1 [Latimeria chalumnae]
MEIWSSGVIHDECNGNVGLDNNSDLIVCELEEVLCSERVGRVTKTYHDIEAVSHLLEEKERDLELAARIGQSLLKQNQSLTEKDEYLEEQLQLAKEEIAQLRHEIAMRDDLLHVYTNTAEESESSSTVSTPLRRNESSASLQHYIHLDFLQEKLRGLEEENQKLRSEATDMVTETVDFEEQEQQLMIDCVQELAEANREVGMLSEELARKTEDILRQQEEISQLLAQIVDLQQKCKSITTESEELSQHLALSRERQEQLRLELKDLQEKHAEYKELLQETREENKNLRNKALPNSTINCYSALNIFPLDSLAAEIEGTMRKGIDTTVSSEHNKSYMRVFETVKTINQAAKIKSRSVSPQSAIGSSQPSAAQSAAASRISTPRTSFYGSDSASMVLDEKSQTLILQPETPQAEGQEKKIGTPGTPGGRDLKAALERLSARQESHSSEGTFFEAERESKLRKLANEAENSSGFMTPNDSILSTGTNYSGSSDFTGGSGFSFGSRSYLPDKLQIVKPLEGSVTLHHWQQLAKPNMGGILDPRPGVLTKDFRQLDFDSEEVYNLNDFEEDELDTSTFQALATSSPTQNKLNSRVCQSSNNLPQTQSTNTITTCRIMHPSDEFTTVTPSLFGPVLPSCGSLESLRSAHAAPPCKRYPSESSTNCREHTMMLSTSLGLVTLLKERGISAAVHYPCCVLASVGARLSLFPTLGAAAPSPNPLPSPISLQNRSPLIKTFPASRVARSILKGDRSEAGSVSLGPAREGSIFSLNLVEKLKKLGLDKVVARGMALAQTAAQRPSEPTSLE